MGSPISASFARPADTTPYGIGDLVANSTTAGSVLPLDFGSVDGVLEGLRIRKTSAGVTGASFRLWLYAVPMIGNNSTYISVANGDNGALSLSTLGRFVGRFTIAAMETHAALAEAWGVMTPDDALRYLIGGQRIIGYLEARGAYTPANAETFEVFGVVV